MDIQSEQYLGFFIYYKIDKNKMDGESIIATSFKNTQIQ